MQIQDLASRLSGRVLAITESVGRSLHISSKWAAGAGFIVLLGIGMTFIQVEEYGLAVLLWVASAIVLFSKAIHWTGFQDRPKATQVIRILWLLIAVSFVPLSIMWTQAKRSEKPWTAFRWPGRRIVAKVDKGTTSATGLLDLSVTPWPHSFALGADIHGVKWKGNYAVSNLMASNTSDGELNNIELTVSTDSYIVRVVQDSVIPDVDIEMQILPATPVTQRYNGKEMSLLPKSAFGNLKSVRVFCRHLDSKRTLSLLIITVDIDALGGVSDTSRDQEFILLSGTIETGIVDGSKRLPVNWKHYFHRVTPTHSVVQIQRQLDGFCKRADKMAAQYSMVDFTIDRKLHAEWAQAVTDYLNSQLGHSYAVDFSSVVGTLPPDFPPSMPYDIAKIATLVSKTERQVKTLRRFADSAAKEEH
jgi:hypothetical protein